MRPRACTEDLILGGSRTYGCYLDSIGIVVRFCCPAEGHELVNMEDSDVRILFLRFLHRISRNQIIET